jgi:hypothetical protein
MTAREQADKLAEVRARLRVLRQRRYEMFGRQGFGKLNDQVTALEAREDDLLDKLRSVR